MSLSSKINLAPDEEIVAIFRRHHGAHFWTYFFGFGFLFASAFFLFYLTKQGYWGIALLAICVVLGLFLIFRAWFLTTRNRLVLTDLRLVDIDRSGWLDETVSAVRLSQIADAYVHRRGMRCALFNCGTLAIETKTGASFVAECLFQPQAAQDLITRTRSGLEKQNDSQDNQKELEKIIKQLGEDELLAVQDLVDRRLTALAQTEEDVEQEDGEQEENLV